MSQPERLRLVDEPRSACPVNLFSEVLADRWSLVVLRDVMFAGRTGFRELLDGCEEGIASNVLSSRLRKLTALGLLAKHPDPDHQQKIHYLLTEPSVQLLPVMIQIGLWASDWLPVDPALAEPSRQLHAGGADAVNAFMDELRTRHLDPPWSRASTVSGAP